MLLRAVIAILLVLNPVVIFNAHRFLLRSANVEGEPTPSSLAPTTSGRVIREKMIPVGAGGLWHEDISPAVSCGRNKCLFPLRDANPAVGYLISNIVGRRSGLSQRTLDSYRYARFLEAEYGMRHLLLGSPREVNVTDDFAARRLNVGDLTKHSYQKNGTTAPPLRFVGGPVLLQKVRIAPEPWLLVGCYQRYSYSLKHLDRFLSESFVKGNDEDGSDGGRGSFVANLVRQLNLTKQLLRQSEAQCLFRDFQLILTSKGDLYHLDLDRCLASPPRKGRKGRGGGVEVDVSKKRQCLAELDGLVERCKSRVIDGA